MNRGGSYFNLSAKAGRVSGNFDAYGKGGKATFGVWNGNTSAEVGQRSQVSDTVSIETNARFTYGYVDDYNYRVDKDLTVNADAIHTSVLRLNAALTHNFVGGIVFFGGSYYRDYSKATKLTLSAGEGAVHEDIKLSEEWGNVNFGAEFDLSETAFMHAEVSRLLGDDIGANWKAALSFTCKF